MDAHQLRILRELGELGSVSAVARALLVTPSAISQQLRLLQRSVPAPLTERAGRRLVLTDAGRALAAAAVDVETALAQARATVEEFVAAPAGEVSLAAFHSAAAAFFPRLLRHPDEGPSGPAVPAGTTHREPAAPTLRLHDEDVPQQRFPALTRDYDLVLAHRMDHAPPWPRTVRTTTLLDEPLDVAVPAAHPLAARGCLRPADVAEARWIAVHEGFPLLPTLQALAAQAGRPLQVVHRINEFTVAAQVVAAGGGLALVPRWTAAVHPDVRLLPLVGVHASRHVDVLHRPERATRQAVQTVLDRLREVAAQVRGEAPDR